MELIVRMYVTSRARCLRRHMRGQGQLKEILVEFGVQLISQDEADNLPFDILDATKVVSEELRRSAIARAQRRASVPRREAPTSLPAWRSDR